MPFGLRNAGQTFQRFMDQVLRGLHFCFVYVDDILIASSSEEEHKEHLRKVLQRLSNYGIIINPSKCLFGVSSLEFLCHHVSRHGIRPLGSKVDVIRQFPRPVTARKLRGFIGLINFYHRFVPHCADILRPLNAMLARTRPHQQLIWTDETTTAFQEIKATLAQATLLNFPVPASPTCIVTDASDTAVGAVLQQLVDDIWCPISYFSKKLKPSETRYSTFDRELLAMYLAIRHFRHFVVLRAVNFTYVPIISPSFMPWMLDQIVTLPGRSATSTLLRNSLQIFALWEGLTMLLQTPCLGLQSMPHKVSTLPLISSPWH